MYILQVGNLLASRYHGQSDCFHAETLATAILQENCPHAVDGKEAFVQLRKLVEQTLKLERTLVILDGLDESDGCS